jgi:hypothetical protein
MINICVAKKSDYLKTDSRVDVVSNISTFSYTADARKIEELDNPLQMTNKLNLLHSPKCIKNKAYK